MSLLSCRFGIAVLIRLGVIQLNLSQSAFKALSILAAGSAIGAFTLIAAMWIYWAKCGTSPKCSRTIWFFVLLFGLYLGVGFVLYDVAVHLPSVRLLVIRGHSFQFPSCDRITVSQKWTVLIENGQYGVVSRASRALGILLSADYKELPLGAPIGTVRADVAMLEDIECNTFRMELRLGALYPG